MFILVVLFALFVRVYHLGSVPSGLTWDEAALGYNAYSLIQTGKDEYGSVLPLILKSFGDYKPALYAYLAAPFVFIFGLNEFAVRLPSALAGVGFVIASSLIIWEIFKNKKLVLLTAFFTAVSPISIIFSRAAYESNIAVFLNVLGSYFFLKGLKNSKYFYGTAISFVLSILCYQGSKLFIPLLIVGLFLVFRKQIHQGKNLNISLGLVLIGIAAAYILTFGLGQSGRLQSQNLFAYTRGDDRINQIAGEDGLDPKGVEFNIVHGEWLEFTKGLAERYYIYFAPDILFSEGDYSPRHSVPDLGILNYYAIILIPFGFYMLWRRREPDRLIVFFWLFTASIPAVFSRDLISMVRALNLMFPFAVLEAFGLYFILYKIAEFRKIFKYLSYLLLTLLIGGNLLIYFDYYFIHLPKDSAQGWLYGYKQAFQNISNTSKYDTVVFTDTYGQPYIYYLFYNKYPPQKFQEQAVLTQETVDVGTVRKIDNLEFRKINWPVDRGLENTLFIGTGIEIPNDDIKTELKSSKLLDINFPDGDNAFRIVENKYE